MQVGRDELRQVGDSEISFRFFSRTDEEYRPTYELIRQGRMPEAESLFGKLLNRMLAEDEDARCVAGGASLVAMINARLVEPSILIGLRRVEEINSIETAPDGSVQIGAGVRHVEIAIAED